ncbi:OmpA family protein [Flavobacterium sp.]|uniref:OmpA family protein n=1 Tax=Flavobacterium sp. TaxID=239 RepID=UPI00286E2EBE|nr:OmpA family protein [Flavobacterium sp.]
MKNGFQILILFYFCCLTAQENSVQSVYFEVDKSVLSQVEIQQMEKSFETIDFSTCKSIRLYGYCDDRGSIEYNDKLSKSRVTYIQKILISKGAEPKKIFIAEGRGEVTLETDTLNNLEEIRYKNRRVDIIFEKERDYYTFPEDPKIGDVVILKGVTFDIGSSELSANAKIELDRTVLLLKKHKSVRFEVKGHVCCTSGKNSDAIDKETQDRDLSGNRARNVFMYLRSKGISPYRMSYKGYGNRFPLGKEAAQDRRVELYITQL